MSLKGSLRLLGAKFELMRVLEATTICSRSDHESFYDDTVAAWTKALENHLQ
jgi:hypothetical protein